MRFSLANLLVITGLICLLMAATFGMPSLIGLSLHCFVSLVVLPPIIFVGVLSTKGQRRAFFAGAMVSGIPHFIWSVYFTVTMGFELLDGSGVVLLGGFGGGFNISLTHVIGYMIGLMGGLSGVATHRLLAETNSTG